MITFFRRRRAVTGGVLAICLSAAVALAGAAPASAKPHRPVTTGQRPVTTYIGGAEVDLTFNDPVNHQHYDATQLINLIRLINGAGRGTHIRAAFYSISDRSVYDALVAAHKRGVIIEAVQNGANRFHRYYHDSTPRKLAALLGSNNTWCDHGSYSLARGTACISDDPSGRMHAKYMLFSHTRDRYGRLKPNVVWFGSPNETPVSGTLLSNNSVTVYGDTTLYENFRTRLWNVQRREGVYADNAFFQLDPSRGYFTSGNGQIKVFASPQQAGDLVADRLSLIAPGPDCYLYVMENMIHDGRPEVIDQLLNLRAGGCHVSIVADQIDPGARLQFAAAGIPMRIAPVHDKTMVFRGRFVGASTQHTMVLTGSHNITVSALEENDEILVSLQDNQTLFHAYWEHFHDLYDVGRAY